MRISFFYAWSQLTRNKRTGAFLCLAAFIACTLITAICSLGSLGWQQEEYYYKLATGDYHAAFTEFINEKQLEQIRQNPAVETVMMQTNWRWLKLADAERDYIVLSRYNEAGFQGLPLRQLLTTGHLPQKPGEVIVSEQLLADRPDLSIGSTLTLPAGKRTLGGEELPYSAVSAEGEQFLLEGELTITIVGVVNMQAVTAFPAYHAYGFVDEENLDPTDTYQVRMKLYDLKQSYQIFPQIAAAIGLEDAPDGSSPISYNSAILGLHGVRNPQSPSEDAGSEYTQISVVGTLGVMLLFFVIIYNAFSAAAQGQLKQLGILKSIGASPKQIRGAVLWQGLLVCLPSIPLGLVFGFPIIRWLFFLADSNGGRDQMPPFSTMPWQLSAVCALATLITVLFSSWLPARKLARYTPIEAVKGLSPLKEQRRAHPPYRRSQHTLHRREQKHLFASRFFGIEGELAMDSMRVNRRPYRTTMLCLTLCIALLTGALTFVEAMSENHQEQLSMDHNNQRIQLALVDDPDPDLLRQLSEIPEMKSQVIYRSLDGSTLFSSSGLTPEFMAAGGFDMADNQRPEQWDDDSFLLNLSLIGLEDQSFADYCSLIGTDPAEFNEWKAAPAILVNSPVGTMAEARYYYPDLKNVRYLELQKGDSIQVSEQQYTEQEGSFAINSVEIVSTTNQYPDIDENIYPFYVTLIVPMPVYDQLTMTHSIQNTLRNRSIIIEQRYPEEYLEESKAQADRISSAFLPASDYSIRTRLDSNAEFETGSHTMRLAVLTFSIFMAIVAISSAFAAVSNSIAARRRQFAVLHSVGLTPEGLARMLWLEGLTLSLKPLIPGIILGFSGSLFGITILPFISVKVMIYAIPWHWIFPAVLLILGSVFLAYYLCSRRILSDTIVEAIRDETLTI